MNKKTIGVAGIYILIMLPLLLLTYGANWNPSNISYDLDGETLVIKEGLGEEEVAEVNVQDRMNELLQFTLAVSVENKQWKTDVLVIGILLPFILFAIVPERRPFKKNLSFKWYMTSILAILVLYAAYSVPAHVTQIAEVHQYVDHLLE
ncbi:hypothetical protein SAMN05192559_101573 [Halobacillus karajensis]|uniref:hypothetical protein n=1 Tax=Halobacillus karajensis TaxID=195088 RepID=UPI0008A7D431|nr:hypothetical protein [Halobacillus karajensis]SEH46158.1 hypothetical protein SAMN05192559_101573 [Halobacillus karajensis]